MDNIRKSNDELGSVIRGQVAVFRPPYGAINDELDATLGEMNMNSLMWNRDREDWKTDKALDIINYFKKL
ncbi:hypothetical protein [Paenibacillus maysiensis]|uniref:hypothetical protein n=1 Tax=Paenibacillus maysiensis TaxID=1155954 RepID=UPI00047062EC|nr:hypothetical protein [Paenibacillus maysiensis]